jgi:release factor glutamine methyltransferase
VAADLTVAAALRAATTRLAASDSPRLDAELLLAHSLGVSRTYLYSHPEIEVDAACKARFEALLDARARHTPLAYLTGCAEFWSLTFTVTPAVLVPRAETEVLVAEVLAAWPADRPGVMLDIGTGSGAIAAAIAHERPALSVFASDCSDAALRVARNNFVQLGLERVACLRGHWLRAMAAQSLDLIVSNPPYVGAAEAVDAAVTLEPATAVYADDEGLAALAAIVNEAPRCLKPGGHIALEHGYQQGAQVRALLAAQGFKRIASTRDLAGHERVSAAWRD